jgi:hypothetical protein
MTVTQKEQLIFPGKLELRYCLCDEQGKGVA